MGFKLEATRAVQIYFDWPTLRLCRMRRVMCNARDAESLRMFELQKYQRLSKAHPSCVLRNATVIRELVRLTSSPDRRCIS